MSRVYSRCNPLLLVHPRHSSVYRYSSVRLYLPATFQFHCDGGTSAPRAPRRCFFFFLSPRHTRVRVQFWTRHAKSDEFLLFSTAPPAWSTECEGKRRRRQPGIPLRGGPADRAVCRQQQPAGGFEVGGVAQRRNFCRKARASGERARSVVSGGIPPVDVIRTFG